MASERDCIDALREAARQLGASPSKAEYEELGLTPASATIIRTLGGWNDAKARAGLSTSASTGSRVGPPPAGVDDDVRERWEALSVDQRWHYRNQAWNSERTLERRAKLREWVDEQKSSNGCRRCGESDPRCLDLHHCDAAEKSDEISEMITNGASKRRLREEIAKCEVLCANCHRAFHAEEFDRIPGVELRREAYRLIDREHGGDPDLTLRQRQRRWVRQYKATRGCAECGHRTGAVLDLHHVDPGTKTASVGRLISDGCPVRRLLGEIEQCEVLCANCHRKRHADNAEVVH